MAGRRPVGLSLNLDMSLRDDTVEDWGANTFRKDGVSISINKARLDGQEIEGFEVEYLRGPGLGRALVLFTPTIWQARGVAPTSFLF
jgi:hypothetical protein